MIVSKRVVDVIDEFYLAAMAQHESLDAETVHKKKQRLIDSYNTTNSYSKEGIKYQSAMISLTKGFSTAQMGIAVSRFLNFSIEGEGYRNERGYKYCDGDGTRYRPHTSLLNKYSKDLY